MRASPHAFKGRGELRDQPHTARSFKRYGTLGTYSGGYALAINC